MNNMNVYICITGEPGVGKTLVLRRVRDMLTKEYNAMLSTVQGENAICMSVPPQQPKVKGKKKP